MVDRPRLKTPFDALAPAPARPPAGASATPAPRRRGRFAFSTRAFFAAVFVLSFAAAGYAGVSRAGEHHFFYMVFSLMTPFVVLAVALVAQRLGRRRSRAGVAEDRGPFDS